jgi:hypothetical protein
VDVLPYTGGAACELAAPPVALMGLMSGRLSFVDGARRGEVVVRGDHETAALLPSFFAAGG